MSQLRTQSEINDRVFYFKQAVLSAKTVKQLQETLRTRKVSHEQFRTKTLSDLIQDQSEIVTYLPLDDRIKRAEQMNKNPPIIIMAANAEINDIDEDKFIDLKKKITEQTPTLPLFTMYISQCSLTSDVRSAISGDHEYLRAIPFNQP